MNPKRQHTTRHWLQLQETLLAMGLGAILAGTALEMTVRTWRYCRDAAEFARLSQQTLLLRQGWRRFVHDCPQTPVLTGAGALQAGDWEAVVEPARVVLRRGADTRYLHLPAGMAARIAAESGSGPVQAWTLVVTWSGRPGGPPRDGSSRIVACRQEVPR